MKPRFCADCGLPVQPHSEWFACENGHRTFMNSKPTAGGLVHQDGKLLLVRRAIDPWRGYWDIPGGFLKNGEPPQDGALREVEEETGFSCAIDRLLGVYLDTYYADDPDFHIMNFYFVMHPTGGSARLDHESDAVDWFPIDALPDIAFEHAQHVLRDFKASLKR